MTNRFKQFVSVLSIGLVSMIPRPARADMFGGDVAVLVQILSNAIQQLQQLQRMVGTASDNLALVREINRGINDSLGMMQTIAPYKETGIYKDWDKVSSALEGLKNVYGSVAPSKIASMQEHTDQNIAEAITLNNSIYAYTKDIDQIGETIKQYSHAVSPGGAQKLTAESLGVMLNVMNESLRAQATGLKIQAQTLAVQNQKDKEYVRHVVDSSQKLSVALKAQDTQFKLPRF